ncbi:MAG: hypothetical protein IJF71_02590 [Clostridia bacterium]|nr:hypothetical protein [Clostridia bacterium]
MKYCKECGVYCHRGLKRCPLCGSFLESEREAPDALKKYHTEIELSVSYPPVEYEDQTDKTRMRYRAFTLLLATIAICFAINFVVTPSSLWSLYVLVGSTILYFCVFSSLFRHSRAYSILATCTVLISVGLFGFDAIQSMDRLGNLSAVGFSVCYAIPGFLIAMIVTFDILIFVGRNTFRYYFISLYIASVSAIIPQIVFWAIPSLDMPSWFTLAAFFFAVFNCVVMTVCYSRRVHHEFVRKFYI